MKCIKSLSHFIEENILHKKYIPRYVVYNYISAQTSPREILKQFPCLKEYSPKIMSIEGEEKLTIEIESIDDLTHINNRIYFMGDEGAEAVIIDSDNRQLDGDFVIV